MKPDLDGQTFDVAIIGGGINGASAAQHLAAEGYSVVLFEKDDFGSGASSRSSRLLHCGLRHLASGSGVADILSHPVRLAKSVATARDDMLARDEIVRTTPNRVRPIHFCLPHYADEPYAPWHMDVAFSALRLASPRGEALDFKRYGKSRLDAIPIADWLRDPAELRGASVFREYIFDWPERIVLDAIADAERLGAVTCNYTKVVSLAQRTVGKCWEVTVQNQNRDRIQNVQSVSVKLILNLAGAWVDRVNDQAGQETGRKCRGTKGIHIAVQLPDAFQDWGLFTYNSLGEPLYCLPWRGHHYVGLTRTAFDNDATGIYASDAEIDWMLAETNRAMPRLELTRTDVLYSWAGVNPLTFDPNEPDGSREIKIHDLSDEGLQGMFTLTGGPIMTHRRVAKRFVEAARKHVKPSGQAHPVVYDNSDRRTVSGTGNQLISNAVDCARREQPQNLSDVLMRRLGLGWNRDQGRNEARAVAEAIAPVLGWNTEQVDQEIQAYSALLDKERRRPSLNISGKCE